MATTTDILSLSGLEQATIVPPLGFVFNLLIAILLGLILRDLYVRYGTSLTNRRTLASNFVILILTTMFIITVVKSSLALSLGLVGALSIIRFRTAIKEPEELAYLFLCISIGLGLGADQVVITLVGFAMIALFIWIRGFFTKVAPESHVFLQIHGKRKEGIVEKIVIILQNHCKTVHLKRLEENDDVYEALFVADFPTFEKLTICKEQLRNLDPEMRCTILDNRS
ncbi:MAG: hypothetical protein A3C02_02375 [Candidatus Andersenbacteria bacterium RIFCSPHIGHO2_02_FULL_45_11]|uniref:DUF4956 domain-containing protein n=1 Tax=Candidatus Andersenbacteria bacterium RIFCSPHIGHO2_12_FULL_45_11 TaxID=1797281 RepID=A0A1G1X282_9BACT|nr:MAG: hypothetical protein A3C02_02375 [Candidatus Andersenbacteria bacterium RIFCSPHIGHO2_02_FULL_45_11]OGY34125.1 MAG: hypothetical protein A3D99_02030 [Candidatus Andersenbacteria bacterium RIFCSPHIGHO2_12_FULL_45_11]